MFEGVNDAALIDAMGDASRAESAAIAQRLGYDCYTASPEGSQSWLRHFAS